MDSDLWTSRLAAAKRQYNLHHHHHNSNINNNSQLDRLGIDDFEVEEEVRPDFACPYCFEDYDIASLCSHLEDEHPFESKVTVCPICSVKITRDMLNHITLQHGHLFKMQRRRRLRRVALPNSQALSLLGRDLREAHLQVLLGGGGFRSSSANATNTATDSFLQSLVLNFPSSEVEDISKSAVLGAEDTSVKNTTLKPIWKTSRVGQTLGGCTKRSGVQIPLASAGVGFLSFLQNNVRLDHPLKSFDPSLSLEEREQKMRQVTVRVGFVQDLVLSTLFSD